jgi:hypothetical protein
MWCAGCKASSIDEDSMQMVSMIGKNGLEKVMNLRRVLRAIYTNV